MLQLDGGYGYMMEYPIARAFVNARMSRIYGGISEVMKELIPRGLQATWRLRLTRPRLRLYLDPIL